MTALLRAVGNTNDIDSFTEVEVPTEGVASGVRSDKETGLGVVLRVVLGVRPCRMSYFFSWLRVFSLSSWGRLSMLSILLLILSLLLLL